MNEVEEEGDKLPMSTQEVQLPIGSHRPRSEAERSIKTESKADTLQFDTLSMFGDDYAPESELVNFEELKKSDYFKTKRYMDALYKGEIVNGKRQGKGVMRYRNARIYEGDWEADLRHGKGFEKYPNGN